MKKLFLFLLGLFMMSNTIFAQKYILFYAEACPHCQEVEKFFQDNNVIKNYNIEMKEVRKNGANLKLFMNYLNKLNKTIDSAFVPFMVIDQGGDDCGFVEGDYEIKQYFAEKMNLGDVCEGEDAVNCDGGAKSICTISEKCEEHQSCKASALLDGSKKDGVWQRFSFFAVMLPAAFADSINPCAFAVMLLLLSGILSKEKNHKKAILAGLLFTLSVFISYFAMGIGLFSALATAQNTFVLKLIVGALGIIVGLANLKDFFWYGKGFVMEVPFSWRPMMQKIIKKAVSPAGAFVVGLIVSMFLLPCTSGPYFTVLGYLASESNNLHFRGYIYLFVYNVIFIIPMLIITGLVGFGFKSVEELAKLKNNNKKIIHLIVGLLMLGLGIYVLVTM